MRNNGETLKNLEQLVESPRLDRKVLQKTALLSCSWTESCRKAMKARFALLCTVKVAQPSMLIGTPASIFESLILIQIDL